MVSTQTLKLLDALLAGSSGSQKDKLLALYKEAFRGTEGFKDLKNLLEGCEFHGTEGKQLLLQGEDVVKSGFTNADGFGDRITVMDYVVRRMRKEMDATAEYILSANVSGNQMNVVDRQLADNSTKYYEILFNYVCCLYTTLYGESVLQNFKIKTGIRSTDLVRNVNDELCSFLADVRRREKPRVWRIVRTHFGGANLVGYNGFTVEYGNLTPDYLDGSCEQIAPGLFRDRVNSDVLCCGIGCLTSLEPCDGGRIYGAQVVSKPAMNCLDHLDIDYDQLNVRALLAAIAGSGVCVMEPAELVELLNRYFMIKTARGNKRRGCIYCGKNNCRHFRITKEFTM